MTEWNFNMEEAPKGGIQTVTRKTRKGDISLVEFVSDPVLTASQCGKVIVSYWIPEAKRWNRYTKDVPPIAWQPFPTHPNF